MWTGQMRLGQVPADAEEEQQRYRACRQAARKKKRRHTPDQRGSNRRCLRKFRGTHHRHDLVDEDRLAEPDPRHQEQASLNDTTDEHRSAPDCFPTLDDCGDALLASRLRSGGRSLSDPKRWAIGA